MLRFIFIFLFPNLIFSQNRKVTSLVENKSFVYDSLFLANDYRSFMDAEMIPVVGSNWKEMMAVVGDNVSGLKLGVEAFNESTPTIVKITSNKYIILDFWSTSCRACIAAFPMMEDLQEKFNEQLQIYLVNCWETEAEIAVRLVKRKVKIPKLPVVVGTKELLALFPATSIPHHVWIDNKGTVKMIGSNKNTYFEKIQKFITGRSFTFLQSENTIPSFSPSIAYSKMLRKDVVAGKYFSFWAPFDNYYSTQTLGKTIGHFDTASNSIRNTFINNTIFDLLRFAFKNDIQLPQNVYPLSVANINLKIRDTLDITDLFLSSKDIFDEVYIKSRYCYEQIIPANFSGKDNRDLMKNDLIKFCDSIGYSLSLVTKDAETKSLIKKKSIGNNNILKIVLDQTSDTFQFQNKSFAIFRNMDMMQAIRMTIGYPELLKELRCRFLVDDLQGRKEPILVLPLAGDARFFLEILKDQGYLIKDRKMRITTLEISDKHK